MTDRPYVLVVEDDDAIRLPLEKFLELRGFAVQSAITAGEALETIARRLPDGAIVDLRLPGGSGRDVAQALPAAIPVVIFSGVPQEAGGVERSRPNTRLILKPFSLVMLVESLKKMIGQRDA
jgi:DNA-binding response OmpR family regulator